MKKLLTLLCLVLLWICLGRNRKLPVVPLFAPPEGLSPGVAAHVAGMEGGAGRADLLWTASGRGRKVPIPSS